MAHVDAGAQERAAREALRPERHQVLHIFPHVKSGAPADQSKGAAEISHQPGASLMAAQTSMAGVAVKRDWYELHDDFAGVLDWAIGEGRLDKSDLYDYASEPWGFDHLYEAWRVSLHAAAADDNRVDAQMERVA